MAAFQGFQVRICAGRVILRGVAATGRGWSAGTMGCGASSQKLEEQSTSLAHFQVERILGKGAFGKVKAVVKKTKTDKVRKSFLSFTDVTHPHTHTHTHKHGGA